MGLLAPGAGVEERSAFRKKQSTGHTAQGAERRAQSAEHGKTTASIEKPRRERGISWFRSEVSGGKFFLCPLLSGYQVQHQNRPNIFESIVVEVAWNQRQNFRTAGEKLDNFSTFRGFRGNRGKAGPCAQSRVSKSRPGPACLMELMELFARYCRGCRGFRCSSTPFRSSARYRPARWCCSATGCRPDRSHRSRPRPE